MVGITDNMVAHGRSEEEHDQNLLNLMKAAKDAELVFNSKKCRIKLPEIHFFGPRPDPKKVQDIQEIPGSQSKIQKFLGIITYLSPFIPHLFQKTTPLQDLLKLESEFQWNASHESAFQAVKDVMSEETTLAYVDHQKKSTIQVDASFRGSEQHSSKRENPLLSHQNHPPKQSSIT